MSRISSNDSYGLRLFSYLYSLRYSSQSQRHYVAISVSFDLGGSWVGTGERFAHFCNFLNFMGKAHPLHLSICVSAQYKDTKTPRAEFDELGAPTDEVENWPQVASVVLYFIR
jgi:hypothetical protein